MRFNPFRRSVSGVGYEAGGSNRWAALRLWLGTYAGVTIVIRLGRVTRTINIGRPW